MSNTPTAGLASHHRDAVLEAVHGLLGEARDIVFHQSGEPGDWAYDDADGQELLDAAEHVRTRLDAAVGQLRRAIRSAEASQRARRR